MKSEGVCYHQFNRFGGKYLFDILNLNIVKDEKFLLEDFKHQNYDLDNLTIDLLSINYFYDYIVDNTMKASGDGIEDKLKINTAYFIQFIQDNCYEVKLMNFTFLYNNVFSDYIIERFSDKLPDMKIYVNYMQDTKKENNDFLCLLNRMLGKQDKEKEIDSLRLQLITYNEIEEIIRNLTINKLVIHENLCLFFLQMINKEKKLLRCSAGINHLYIDLVNSNIRCCRYSNTFSGNLIDGINFKAKLDTIHNSSLHQTKCQECWCRFLCGGQCTAYLDDYCEQRKDMFEILLIVFNEIKVLKAELLSNLIEQVFKYSCTDSYISERMISTKAEF
ncbi:MAG: hypothetical protein ACERKZ_05050 [Lachnotalea sp.]